MPIRTIEKNWKDRYGDSPVPLWYLKRSAWGQFNKKVSDGLIERQPCSKCGKPKAQGHHEDYTKPFDVIWLCQQCHKSHHMAHCNKSG